MTDAVRPSLTIRRGGGRGIVLEVDGTNIANACTGLTLELNPDSFPIATVDLLALDLTVESDQATMQLRQNTHDALVALGWTPPAEA